MKYEGIGTGYFSLDDELRQARREYAWTKFVARHRAQLDQIANIVRLGCLWQKPANYRFSTQPVKLALRLKYAGQARNHQDAAADLGQIIDVLHCTDGLRLNAQGGGNTQPYGCYEGVGQLGPAPVRIELDVPWLPENCTVHHEPGRRTWTTEGSYYSVYCRR